MNDTDYELLGWNYRLFRRQVPDGLGGTMDEYTVREAYYDQNGAVTAWTEGCSAPMGESKADALYDFEMMRHAFDKPTIEITSDGNALTQNDSSGGN